MPIFNRLPMVRFKQLPPLFCLSFGALLSLLITGVVYSQRFEQKNEQLLRDHGRAMAALTAFQAVDAAVADDLLGLHAQLQTVADQPRVRLATILDANDKVLVQAGEARDVASLYTVSTPILVEDMTVGQVTVSLVPEFQGDAALRWTFWGISIVLILLALMSLFETRGDGWYFARPSQKNDDGRELEDQWAGMDTADSTEFNQWASPIDVDPDVAEIPHFGENPQSTERDTPETEAEVEEPVQVHSDLIILLPNRRKLQQQLCIDVYDRLMDKFEKIVTSVAKVYGGERVETGSDDYHCIRFTVEHDATEASYKAVCAAYLIRHFSQQQKFKLEVLAQICSSDCDVKLALNDKGIYLQDSLLSDSLAERLDTAAISGGRVHIEGLKAPYVEEVQGFQTQLTRAIA